MATPHTVSAGETLSGLALRYGISLQAIKNANSGLASRTPPWGININEVINIPTAPASTAASTAASATGSTTGSGTAATTVPASPTAVCCPETSTFEGQSSGDKTKYFGFDDRTNIVATPGTDEYWIRPAPPGSLTLPGNKLTRDDARWVSVAVDKETEVEIEFAGHTGLPCISNCTFEVVPPTIASVITTSITNTKVSFKIKGVADGEASLKVICNGNDIGWFHIWCKAIAKIKVDVSVILTTKTPAAVTFNLASLQSEVEEIFKQAALKIDWKYLGVVDLTRNAALQTTENSAYTAATATAASNFAGAARSPQRAAIAGVLTALDAAAIAAPLSDRPNTDYTVRAGDALSRIASNHGMTQAELLAANPSKVANPGRILVGEKIIIPSRVPRSGAYQLYWYVPTNNPSGLLGSVINVGDSPAFGFMPDSAIARNSMAHELGHSLGLRHPSDPAGSGQFAAHNLTTRNQVVVAKNKTNTEPAIPATLQSSNVLANDPTNLMGYWGNRPDRTPLRYHQWKSIKRS